MKWAGTRLPSVPILERAKRDLCACRILDIAPQTIDWGSFSDSGKHMAPIAGRKLEVTYVVLSENFPPARCAVRIEPGDASTQARLNEIGSAI
jgi:hypothetical protein